MVLVNKNSGKAILTGFEADGAMMFHDFGRVTPRGAWIRKGRQWMTQALAHGEGGIVNNGEARPVVLSYRAGKSRQFLRRGGTMMNNLIPFVRMGRRYSR